MSGSLGIPNGQSMGVSNSGTPKSSRIYSFTVPLTTGIAQNIDLRALQNLNVLHDVQGMYIDNSQNSVACVIQLASGQNITCPAYSQGNAPAYVSTASPVFTFVGNGNVNIVLLNFPTPVGFWSVQQSAIPVVGGKAQVQDVALENQIVNGAFSASDALYATGDAVTHARAGSAYTGVLTIDGAAHVVIAGAPSVFATNILIKISPDAYFAGGEVLTITTGFTNGGIIDVSHVSIPSVAGAVSTPQADGTVVSLNGVNLLGVIAGDGLQITVAGNALTGGSLRYTIIGGTTGLN